MGTSERKERERKEMQERILKAALELFVREGFEATTIRRIAEAIEYTPGAIYAYFKDKDEIFYELHNVAFSHLLEHMQGAAKEETPLRRFERLGELYIDFALSHPHLYRLIFMTGNTSKLLKEKHNLMCAEGTEADLAGMQAFAVLRFMVQDCMNQGVLPPADIDAAAIAIWSTVHGMVTLYLDERLFMLPQEKLTDILQNAYRFFVLNIRQSGSYMALPAEAKATIQAKHNVQP
jgi:AcrR family transcriptional regulator